jgi:hypothetical protein
MTKKAAKTGKELERRVAQAYRQMGARVEHDKNLGGRQIDVYVELETANGHLHRVAVEAKDYSSQIGPNVVSEFSEVVDHLHRARLIDEGIMISALGYTPRARQAADVHHIIRLLEIADLEEMAARLGTGVPPQTAYIYPPPYLDTLPDEYKWIVDLLRSETIEEFEEGWQALHLTEEQVSSVLRRVAEEGDDFRLRLSAVRKLGEGRYYPIDLNVNVLVEVMLKKDKEEPVVQRAAIEALGNLRSVQGLSVLGNEIKRLDELQRITGTYRDDPDFATDILKAICNIDTRRAFELLVEIGESIEDEKIRNMVTRVARDMEYPSEEAGL